MTVKNLLIWCIVGVILNSISRVRTCSRKNEYAQYPRFVCPTESCQLATQQIIDKMDTNVDPCENFYKFACGNFLRETINPDEKYGMASIAEMHRPSQVLKQIKRSLEEEGPPDELNAFKNAKKFYRACMNKAAIDAKGLNPLRDMFTKFGGWPVVEGDNWAENDFTWTEAIYKIDAANYFDNYLLIFGISMNRSNNEMQLGIGKPVLRILNSDDLFTGWLNLTIQIAVHFGADENQARKEIYEATSIETSLVNYSRTESLKTAMTLAELTATFPTIPWKELFQRILPNITVDENEVIMIQDPHYISNFERVISQTPKRALANYLIYRLTLDLVYYLGAEIGQMYLEFQKKFMEISKSLKPWKKCLNNVLEMMPKSVVGLYIRKYYEKDTKQKATELAKDVRKQFRILLQNADWMDDSTRQHALDKLDAMRDAIAYPDELLDDVELEELYKDLVIDENDYIQALYNLVELRKKYIYKYFRVPISNQNYFYFKFDGTADFFNPYYFREANQINIPFGSLRTVLDTSHVPQYLNYGYLGFVIGHEIAHGFDAEGKNYDKIGNFVNWWNVASTENQFWSKIDCLRHQYDNYFVDEVGLYINGMQTRSENTADNVGIKIAYMAYKDWVQRHGSDEIGLPELPYTRNQMFWLSFASFFCSVQSKESLHQVISTEPHAPYEFRVIGALSNMPEFAEDFKCSANTKMNPTNKCTLW